MNLTLGELNFDTPDYIKEAAKRTLDEGQTHYTVNMHSRPAGGCGGTVPQDPLGRLYERRCKNVIITAGALEGLAIALFALIAPGDEVIVPDPCCPNYFGQIQMVGAKAVPVPVYVDNDYRLQAAEHELYIFSDEPYDQLVYDGVETFSIAQVPEVRPQAVVLNSFSKFYAMTG